MFKICFIHTIRRSNVMIKEKRVNHAFAINDAMYTSLMQK